VPTRLLLIDSQPVALRGLAREVEKLEGFDVVAAVNEITEGVLLTQELRPAVAVYAATGSAPESVTAIRSLRQAAPDVSVLVLGTADSVAGAALAAGAAGFLNKSSPVPLILEAITAVARGDTVVGRSIRSGRVRRASPGAQGDQGLTVREWEVLHLLDEGLNAAQIAERLVISRNTARNYVQNVLTKLGAHSKLEAVALARRAGLLGSE
jgi:DNA-binding NarL/FixJ family response regulator